MTTLRSTAQRRFVPTALAFVALAACAAPQAAPIAAEPAVAAAPLPAPDRSNPPMPTAPKPFELPAARTFTLANGMEVVVLPRPGIPNVAVRLSVRAGRDANAQNVALPALTTRLLRDGTATRTAAQIAEFVDGNGLALGTSLEANRVVIGTDGLSNSVDAMLELIADLAQRPAFPADRVAARKTELLGELERDAAQPDFHLSRLTYKVLFGSHPYAALHPTPEGTREVDARAVKRFFERNYGPARARLVVVGDVNQDLDSRIHAAFDGWSSRAKAWEPAPKPVISVCNEAHVVLRPNSVQTNINWVGPGFTQQDPDWFPALVANQVLGGNAGARLFMNLREAKSYTYGAYSRLNVLYGVGYFSAFSNVRGEVTEGALTEFGNEFAKVADQPFAPQEMASAQDYLVGIFPIQNEANAPLADQVARTLDQGLSLDYLAQYRTQIRAVSQEQAIEAGREYMQGKALTLIMVGQEDRTVAPAAAVSSKVTVYNLDGRKLREVKGSQPRTCTSAPR